MRASYQQAVNRFCGWCRSCFFRLPAASVGGAETASTACKTSRRQVLWRAEKLLPQAGTNFSGWWRNCFCRLPAASVAGAETGSAGASSLCSWCSICFHQAVSSLCGRRGICFHRTASSLSGWCKSCFHRLPAGSVGGAKIASQGGTVEGSRTCFHRLPTASAAGAEPAPAASPEPLWPGVKAAPTGCRQALRPAPEQAASNVYGGCRSCLHRPENSP